IKQGEFVLYETLAICEYADSIAIGGSIKPHDGKLRAQMYQWCSVACAYFYDSMIRRYVLQYVMPKGGTPDRAVIEAAVPDIEKHLGIAERALEGKKFFVGESFTFADAFLAPIFAYLPMFPESKAVFAKFPNVVRFTEAITSRPSFQKTAHQG